MVIVLLILVVLVAAALAAAVLGRIPAPGVLPAASSESFTGLPRGELEAEDLASLRFDAAVRGYRMSQVDAVLQRLSEELSSRDADIARLRSEVAQTHGDAAHEDGVQDHDVQEHGTQERGIHEDTTPEVQG